MSRTPGSRNRQGKLIFFHNAFHYLRRLAHSFGRWIGFQATADLLGQKSCGTVVMVDRNGDLVGRAAKELSSKYPSTKFVSYAYDLAVMSNVKAMLDRTVSDVGGYDVLCNVAAITIGDIEYVEQMNNGGDAYDKWVLMHNVNTTSLSYACQLAVGYFKKTGKKAAIVNVGSTAGIYPNTSMPIYSATKAFVIHLSRCMANLAPQIRVNAGKDRSV